MTDHDTEYEALIAELTEAGLVETFTDDEGRESVRLTPEGKRVGQQLAMTDEAGRDALMEALLDDGSSTQTRGTVSHALSHRTLDSHAHRLACLVEMAQHRVGRSRIPTTRLRTEHEVPR